MKSAETCSYLCNKYYIYIYIYIYIHQLVVLGSRYTPILVYKDSGDDEPYDYKLAKSRRDKHLIYLVFIVHNYIRLTP